MLDDTSLTRAMKVNMMKLNEKDVNFTLDDFTRVVGMDGNRIILSKPSQVPRCSMKSGITFTRNVLVDGVSRRCVTVTAEDGGTYEVDEVVVAKAIHGEVRYGYILTPTDYQQNLYRRCDRVVIKIISRPSNQKSKENPMNEMSFLQHFTQKNLPNICQQIDCIKTENKLYSIMPYYGQELLSKAGKLTADEVRKCYRQVIQAVESLQSEKICHRDLTLENILINEENGVCTVIDFGMSLIVPHARKTAINVILNSYCNNDATNNSKISEKANWDDALTDGEDEESFEDYWEPMLISPQGVYGKENFIPPEIIRNHQEPFNGMLIDNWALSVMLFMLFTGRAPFKRASRDDKWFRLIQRDSLQAVLHRWKIFNIPDLAVDLIEKLLKSGVSPTTRFTTADILSHAWMNEES